jgi:hypothetical protein
MMCNANATFFTLGEEEQKMVATRLQREVAEIDSSKTIYFLLDYRFYFI